MISLQSHNQVLYHLSQLTFTVTPRSTQFTAKVKPKNNAVNKHPNDLCYDSLLEAAKNCTELPMFGKNKHNISSLLRKKKNNVWLIINPTTNDSNIKIQKNNRWKTSYISGSSFTENKQGFPCAEFTEPLILPAICLSLKQQRRLLNLFGSKNSFNYSTQVRFFKTDRNVKVELERNPNFTRRVKNWFEPVTRPEMTTKSEVVNETRDLNTEKLKVLFNDPDMSIEDQKRIKTAFAEGYEAGLQRQLEGRSYWTKILNFITSGGIFLLVLYLVGGYKLNTGNIFRIPNNSKMEVNPEEINVNFSDVKGIDEAKQELKEVVEFLKNPDKFSALGGKLPKGVLLIGPPGTGKTLLARAVAGEAGVSFFHSAGPEFDEVLVGQGARRVRDLFKAAKEKAPCVIFIDEIDSVGAKRTNSVLHPYANQTINQLLSEMDGFHQNEGVIVIGATNRHEDLDKALLRPGRFDVEVYVSPPDYNGRKEILELYLSRILIQQIDIDVLARSTIGFTGADLENMVNQAAIRAAIEGAEYVTVEHLEYAKDKIQMGTERKILRDDEEEILITAYHEAGHALVSFYTKDSHPVHKITIIPRGHSLGHTSYIPEKDTRTITKSQLMAQLDSLMGGRAAEEMIFGSQKVTTGASSDFQRATNVAEEMVRNFGMSEKVGFRNHYKDDSVYGQATKELIDGEVRRLLQEAYERARAILKKHQKELKLVSDALLKYETLDAEDLKAIVSGKKARVERLNDKSQILNVSNKNVI